MMCTNSQRKHFEFLYPNPKSATTMMITPNGSSRTMRLEYHYQQYSHTSRNRLLMCAFLSLSLLLLPSSVFIQALRPSSRQHVCRRRTTVFGGSKRIGSSTALNAEQRALPKLFPTFSRQLQALGVSTPTPIQAASAHLTSNGDSVLLIAPTGSGKTLAYLCPALATASKKKTVLVVAPTRELAIQLARDAGSLLYGGDNDHDERMIQVAVRGLPPPTAADMQAATILIGTPSEVLAVVAVNREFVESLSSVILDEVDVLLPVQPKSMRTALDRTGKTKTANTNTSKFNAAQDERRRRGKKRKRDAMKRRGETDQRSGQVVSPTERILLLTTSNKPQILAGSATASRKTLDTLNRVLYKAAIDSAATAEGLPRSTVTVVRPATTIADTNDVDDGDATDDDETMVVTKEQDRKITVPSEVMHRYVSLSKEDASSPDTILRAVSQASCALKPKTALVFLCGEFGRPKVAKSKTIQADVRPKKTSAARRNVARKLAVRSSASTKQTMRPPPTISAREVCAKLGGYGIDAQPLHVALGLEPNAAILDDDHYDTTPPFLVTFEGSARGLHFDAVDAVFVVGRPASASSYLHLAGRVGRASTGANGDIVNVPGTVVSFGTKGQVTELEKWAKQIGGKGGVVKELGLGVEDSAAVAL